MPEPNAPTIVVVSLPSAVERRRRVAGMLQSLGLEFEFFDAIDGDDQSSLSSFYSCRPDLATSYRFRQRPIGGRELACMLSHMRAIRNAWLRSRTGPLLVLEDDAVFCTAERSILLHLLSRAPDDAAYVQFALTPARTVEALADRYESGGDLFVAKTNDFRIAVGRAEMGCHCAAAYLLAQSAIREITERWFGDGKVLLPCAEAQIASNAALLSDRFVFAAAGEVGRGYACAIPLATTLALDSSLHPDHVPGHAEARDAAYRWSGRLISQVCARLSSA